VTLTFSNIVFPTFFLPYAVDALSPGFAVIAGAGEVVTSYAFEFRAA